MLELDGQPAPIGAADIYDSLIIDPSQAVRRPNSGVLVLNQDLFTYWLKFSSPELFSGRQGLAEGMGPRRSKAAFLVDEALGLGLVPKTYLIHYVHNEVPVELSVQEHAAGFHADFGQIDRLALEKLAVLDYVTVQLDRHSENIFVSDGKVSAIDNDLSFSVSPEEIIQSEPVYALKGQNLSNDLIQRAKMTNIGALYDKLQRLLGSRVADEAVQRLQEVISNNKIQGLAWQGQIEGHFSSLGLNSLSSLPGPAASGGNPRGHIGASSPTRPTRRDSDSGIIQQTPGV